MTHDDTTLARLLREGWRGETASELMAEAAERINALCAQRDGEGEDVVRAAKEFARRQPAPPCHSNRCDYDEPHDHGFACGSRCLCGKGMQAHQPTVPSPTDHTDGGTK